MAECGLMWLNWQYLSRMYSPDSLLTIVVAGPQGRLLADIHDSLGRAGTEAIPYRALRRLLGAFADSGRIRKRGVGRNVRYYAPDSQGSDTDGNGIALNVDGRQSWHYSAQIRAR